MPAFSRSSSDPRLPARSEERTTPPCLLHKAAFHLSVDDLQQLPPAKAEVAVAGRSNAGKSSAINALTRRRRLAYVSKTPGRTQQINLYALGEGRFLADLPGYGYARVPERLRRRWEPLLGTYLQTREPLRGLVLIMDARHPLTELDRRLLDWFLPTGKPVHCLLTKADKLSRQEGLEALGKTRRLLEAGGFGCSVQLFSGTRHWGIEEAQQVIAGWLGE